MGAAGLGQCSVRSGPAGVWSGAAGVSSAAGGSTVTINARRRVPRKLSLTSSERVQLVRLLDQGLDRTVAARYLGVSGGEVYKRSGIGLLMSRRGTEGKARRGPPSSAHVSVHQARNRAHGRAADPRPDGPMRPGIKPLSRHAAGRLEPATTPWWRAQLIARAASRVANTTIRHPRGPPAIPGCTCASRLEPMISATAAMHG